MRLCVFSDVHSNLEALESVLKAAASAKVDRILCAGDLVGYGPDPVACIQLLREHATQVVCGNHDWAAVGRLELEWFNEFARAGVEWTRQQLTDLERDYLKGCSLIWQDSDVTLAHGSLHEPEKFHYVLDTAHAGASLEIQKTPVAFIGHTHVPGIFIQEGSSVSFLRTPEIRIDRRLKYLINVGSVGQPRDGDPRACWCLYDMENATCEVRRVPYPVELTQAKVRAAGLPEFLAERLAYGY